MTENNSDDYMFQLTDLAEYTGDEIRELIDQKQLTGPLLVGRGLTDEDLLSLGFDPATYIPDLGIAEPLAQPFTAEPGIQDLYAQLTGDYEFDDKDD